jgi:murein DD-endopeptidase MepM/ murein hydrolase activator NlpD
LKEKVLKIYNKIAYQVVIVLKKIRDHAPDMLRNTFKKYVAPYGSILLIAFFVFISNIVSAAENSTQFVPNEQVMDLQPGDVAQVVSAINPYTSNFQEDSVQVALAMKNEEYLNKPVITETENTVIASPIKGARKANINYSVDKGDTLSTIGYQYGLKIATIKAVNSLSSDTIRQGQKLILPPQEIDTSYLAKKPGTNSSGTISAFKGTFGRPTRGWNLSQYFGNTSFERNHTGIDLTSRSGTAILASASARVVSVTRGWGGGYGNHSVISHGDGFSTLYGHLSSFMVSSGQWVNQGQQIGVMGNTGWSTGTHLHFEIRKNNRPQNPLQYL